MTAGTVGNETRLAVSEPDVSVSFSSSRTAAPPAGAAGSATNSMPTPDQAKAGGTVSKLSKTGTLTLGVTDGASCAAKNELTRPAPMLGATSSAVSSRMRSTSSPWKSGFMLQTSAPTPAAMGLA